MSRSVKSVPVISLVILFIVMIGALFLIESRNSVTVRRLESENAALKAEVIKKTDQLKVERSRVEALSQELYHGSSVVTAGGSSATIIAKPYQVTQKRAYKKSWRKYSKHRKYRTYKYAKKKRYAKRWTKRRSIGVSRGLSRHPYEDVIKQVGAIYWPDQAELDALVWISRRECIRPGVVSSAGYQGLFQLGNPPKWMVLGDAASETRAGCEYIKRRYGTPLRAKAWKLTHGWY